MAYEDAIVEAIDDLKDYFSTGSSLESIRKRIQATYIGGETWNNSLFGKAIKSLIARHRVMHSTCVQNGSVLYSLTKEYKKERTREISFRVKQRHQQKVNVERNRILAGEAKEPPKRKVIVAKRKLSDTKVLNIDEVKVMSKDKMDVDVDSKMKKKRPSLPLQSKVRMELLLHK